MRRLPFGLLMAGIGMSIAVTVLMLFSASVVSSPVVSALCLFVASLMTWIPLREERGYVWASVEFAVSSLIALLIARNSLYTYLYIALFGHYAILRYFLRTHLTDRLLTLLIRLLAFNVIAAAGLALCEYALDIDVISRLPSLPVFWLIMLMQAVFVGFMLLYKVFSLLFDSAIRNFLMPRR